MQSVSLSGDVGGGWRRRKEAVAAQAILTLSYGWITKLLPLGKPFKRLTNND